MHPRMPRCFLARSANRYACNGCAMTSMAGSPKGRRSWISPRAGVDSQGKIIAWDFVDRSFPLTAVIGPELRLLASRQIGMKPTADGNSNGTAGGGQMYAFENQKCAAPLIPWVQADETPLRTSYLRAPGDMARCFASESFHR